MKQRNNNSDNKKKMFIQMFLSLVLLAGILVCVFVHTENAKSEIYENVVDDICEVAEDYAYTVDVAITRAYDQSYVISNSIRDTGEAPIDEMMDTSLIGLFSHMYAVAENGKGVSENGTTVDLSGSSYWNSIDYKRNRQVLCAEEENGDVSIVTVTTVKTSQNGTWYVVATITQDVLTAGIDKTEFDGRSLFILTDSKGQVVETNSCNTNINKTGNLWDTPFDNQTDAARLKGVMAEGGIGGGTLKCKDENRYLAISPVAKGDLSVVVAVNQSYIDSEVVKGFATFSKLQKQVVLLIVIYLTLQILITMKLRKKTTSETKQLEEKADTDLLTGLNNKLATERKIKEYIAGHPDSKCMMMLFDIDKFKKINDTKGHAFGDEVLRTLGETITGQFRITDIMGRVGGDEFMIFLKNINSEEIMEKEALKLINYFRDFQAGGYVKYSATASVGVAMFPKDGADFESLYKAADEALYRSKENGRNQLTFHDVTKEPIHG